MNQPNALEWAVMTKLLEGSHPLLNELRAQLARCKVTSRQMTGHGFFTYFDVGEARSHEGLRLHIGDVVAEIPGMQHGAGFVLFIENGRLDNLEGFGYDDPWPATITEFTLEYEAGATRDWEALRKIIG